MCYVSLLLLSVLEMCSQDSLRPTGSFFRYTVATLIPQMKSSVMDCMEKENESLLLVTVTPLNIIVF